MGYPINLGAVAIDVVLGADVIVIIDISASRILVVVTLTDSCESTKGTGASTKKIETRILDHMELRNSSVLNYIKNKTLGYEITWELA
jgi:hypothetical protein